MQIDRPSTRADAPASREQESQATRNRQALRVNEVGLAADLRASIEGEVRFDAGSRALYATDGSNYRQVPIGVVIPRSTDDLMHAVAIARRYGAPWIWFWTARWP